MTTDDAWKYIHFDVAGYLKSRLEGQILVLEMLQKDGTWDDPNMQRTFSQDVMMYKIKLDQFEKGDREFKIITERSYLKFIRVLAPIPDELIEPAPKGSLYVGDDLE